MGKKIKRIGILTAGGDSPGLNAAIRGVGKTCLGFYGMEIIGFRDGFRGLVENRRIRLDKSTLAGILTVGGTILGTSRDKPHRMVIDGRTRDMTETIVENYDQWGLDCIVCLGGGGTQKNALRLHQAGLNVVTLPKTIDNDVAMTDATFGFATAMDIATETIDRLHSTAHSHHRIIVAEIMGHRAGWLTLGAGIAGGADVILIPEIPYDVEKIAEAIRRRSRHGTNFSIVAVAEGAMSRDDARALLAAEKKLERARDPARQKRSQDRTRRARSPASGQHPAAGQATGGTHPSRIARHHSRLRPARRHALGGGPHPGHAAGQRVRRPHPRRTFWRDGGGARRRHGTGAAGKSRRQTQGRSAGPLLAANRAACGNVPGRLKVPPSKLNSTAWFQFRACQINWDLLFFQRGIKPHHHSSFCQANQAIKMCRQKTGKFHKTCHSPNVNVCQLPGKPCNRTTRQIDRQHPRELTPANRTNRIF